MNKLYVKFLNWRNKDKNIFYALKGEEIRTGDAVYQDEKTGLVYKCKK